MKEFHNAYVSDQFLLYSLSLYITLVSVYYRGHMQTVVKITLNRTVTHPNE